MARLLAVLLTCAVPLAGCATMSKQDKRELGFGLGALLVAGIAEGIENGNMRERARHAASSQWACDRSALQAHIEFSQGKRHVVSVHGCGRGAWFECGRRSRRPVQEGEVDPALLSRPSGAGSERSGPVCAPRTRKHTYGNRASGCR